MDSKAFYQMLEASPVIAAVKNEAGLNKSLTAMLSAIFVLYGSVVDIPDIVERIARAGKAPVVHLDLVDGLAARESAVDYVFKVTKAAGIISTKGVLIKRAKQLGLIAIQRFFLLDSLALSNIQRQVAANAPDVIEVIPGAMPKVIKGLCEATPLPVIAGGLIRDWEDAQCALNAGAKAISTTNSAIWRQRIIQI